MTSIEREIGKLEAVAASLEQQNKELKAEITEFRDELREIKLLIAEIKGGSRVVFWVGGLVSGGVGAAIFKYGAIFLAR